MSKNTTVQKPEDGKEQMKPTINLLIQIQELTEARAQQELLTAKASLSHLDESIADLMTQVPSRLKTPYKQLQKKGLVAIVIHRLYGMLVFMWRSFGMVGLLISPLRPKGLF